MGMLCQNACKYLLKVSSILDEFNKNEAMYRISPKSLDIDSSSSENTESGTVLRQKSDDRFDQLTFLKRILIGAPQLVGSRRAWEIYNDARSGEQEYVEKVYGKKLAQPPTFSDYEEFKNIHRIAVSIIKREEERAKIPKRRKSAAENEGYSEPIVEPALEDWRFQRANVIISLVEDKWKADSYSSLCREISKTIDSQEDGVDSDEFHAVLKRASEKYLRNESRPVLTNELADYSNPYMMKRAAVERLLHEGCVRNKLEESLVEDVLDRDADLVKMQSQADLPPEVLEPLQAFRGITDWSFDPEIRMEQKLIAMNRFLDTVLGDGEFETTDYVRLSDGKIKHRYRNHVGFESRVPHGRVGGWGQGKPESAEQKDLRRVRYPTLQRVTHSLPSDPHYRSQAVHAIQVLERSRGWTMSDKTKAVNALKEVLDSLPPSKMIVGKLDKALPVARYGRFAPGSLSSSHKFVRRKPSNLLRRNRIRMYFRSMTSTVPLSRRWADRRAKNQVRSKKKDNKR